MSDDVRSELSSLRHMLSPGPTWSMDSSGIAMKTPVGETSDLPHAGEPVYDSVLQGTQKGVHRLSYAMDLADEKVDDALRHTEHVHRLVASHRDLELSELRKVVAAKEQAIDELRQTLSSTRRSLESRVTQLQDTLHSRESQMASMHSKVAQFAAAQSDTAVQKNKLQEQLEAIQSCHVQQNSELHAIVQESQSALTHLRGEKEQLSRQCTDQHHALVQAEERLACTTTLKDELQVKCAEAHRNIQDLETSCHILKKKLIAERKVRKASEQWLRAELKSREDMESLFGAVRDVTLSKSFSGSKSHRIRQLLDSLQVTCEGQHRPGCLPTPCTSHTSSSDQSGTAQLGLKSRLNAARRALQ